MEFESFNEGTLLYIGIEEGNTAPVDSLLAIIGPEGTDISGIASIKAGAKAEENEIASEAPKQKALLMMLHSRRKY
jgi:pyruvate dehydrogenase E2 component (dihydrolipoamide acetyltransferase)